MNDLNIKEGKDSFSLFYMLESTNQFFQTGYKVLRTQEKNGFIKCNQIIYNGKIKLVYDVENLRPLSALTSVINSEVFVIIIKNLLDVCQEVKANGFMQFKNIENSFDKIFIDTNNYKVYLIYLPVTCVADNQDEYIFENKLAENIRYAIKNNPNILSENTRAFYNFLNSEIVTLKSMKDNLSDAIKYSSSKNITQGLITATSAMETSNTSNNISQKSKAQPEIKQERKGLFRRKHKKAEVKPEIVNQSEGGATEILDDVLMNNDMCLECLNGQTEIVFSINKDEFIIGKKADAVDGLINSNNAVSRVHCKIIYKNSEHYIMDMGSSNGTFVNDYRLTRDQQMAIKSGDKIKLANLEFIVR